MADSSLNSGRVPDVRKLFPEAVKNKEFKVFYQPKVFLKDYRLCGAEALCRWVHDGRIISPGNFIPALEQGNEICELDFYMLDQVCQDICAWLADGRRMVRVSINMSRRHMQNEKLINDIFDVVGRYDFPRKYIEIELTETTTDVDFKDLSRVVNALTEQGIHTSVDDFGMGYSSLNLIRDLPWNTLKIDRSFLPEDGDNKPNKAVILQHLIAMAQSMGIECLAEGVETVEQISLLKDNQCYIAQGFYFDMALPHDEFEKRLIAAGQPEESLS
ncbi:MAG: EAL domain-containing protein [Lachnospiraceae bacterium]|nr:EAL domain-containing protein [Lachnospiraceae bacterium]